MALKNHIPNAITSCNLLSGIVGLYFAFKGLPEAAFLCMLAAAMFDFLDGFAARIFKASSPIGGQLDSLSDVVSFGVLPAVMLSVHSLNPLPLLIAVFSAVRLAKFNIDERQHSSFLGLPTPGAALLCGALATYCGARTESLLALLFSPWWAVALLAAAICVLLVCELPFFSFKGLGKKAEWPENIKLPFLASMLVAIAVLTIVLGWHWSAIPFGIATCYILENLVFALIKA
ncbi:MAG: CDP-alcohol phosphatidyltransferase family protein [Bacteroidales bacterium]|nr:CDP-alcohol phosphatidyltransferase family protein [Bacteroidales bacterium]